MSRYLVLWALAFACASCTGNRVYAPAVTTGFARAPLPLGAGELAGQLTALGGLGGNSGGHSGSGSFGSLGAIPLPAYGGEGFFSLGLRRWLDLELGAGLGVVGEPPVAAGHLGFRLYPIEGAPLAVSIGGGIGSGAKEADVNPHDLRNVFGGAYLGVEPGFHVSPSVWLLLSLRYSVSAASNEAIPTTHLGAGGLGVEVALGRGVYLTSELVGGGYSNSENSGYGGLLKLGIGWRSSRERSSAALHDEDPL